MENFARRLKKLRLKKGCATKDVGAVVGVGQRAYLYYEAAVHYPDIHGIIKLADFFGVSTDYLLGRPGTEAQEAQEDIELARVEAERERVKAEKLAAAEKAAAEKAAARAMRLKEAKEKREAAKREAVQKSGKALRGRKKAKEKD